jgi:hypothetical protein
MGEVIGNIAQGNRAFVNKQQTAGFWRNNRKDR